MFKLALAVLLATVTLPATAADAWRDEDTYRGAVVMSLIAVDWLQTRNIARNPDRWTEKNPLIGSRPSVGTVNTRFAIGALAHMAVAYALPDGFREDFQYVTMGIEFEAVRHNYSLGLVARF